MRNRDELTAVEARTLFQDALETELARAVEAFQFGTGSDHEKQSPTAFSPGPPIRPSNRSPDPSTLDRNQEVSAQGEVSADEDGGVSDPWRNIFGIAAKRDLENELSPYWLFEHGDSPTKIRRIVPFLSFSREEEEWPRLRARLA
ncbi:MAG: hypothetical protein H0U34_04760, partial [Sphingomonas sp.]|nr:hypothetical protein [Sphingomonas sp.]